MKQFKTILSFELANYFKNKIFLGTTLFLVILIVGVMFFPRISAGFEEEEGAGEGDSLIMLVIPAAGMDEEAVQRTFAETFPNYQIQTTLLQQEELKNQIVSGEAECAFVLESPTAYTYYVDNLSMYDSNTNKANEALQKLYRMEAMVENGISPETAGEILSAEIEYHTESLGKDQGENFFYTYIMLFALYMVIILYGQMVATNVATEKSSRAMELLITSAKPESMMFGKVIASCLAGFIQLTVVFGTAYLCFNLNKDYLDSSGMISSLFNMPLSLLVYMLIFFILGFLIYAFLFGAVGSTASKVEDINTSSMPLTLLFVIAFIVVMSSMTGGNVDTPLMQAFSYIPFTSSIAMFARITMSTVPFYQVALSIVILIGSVCVIGVISARIYRVGVLLYGTPPKMTAILRGLMKSSTSGIQQK